MERKSISNQHQNDVILLHSHIHRKTGTSQPLWTIQVIHMPRAGTVTSTLAKGTPYIQTSDSMLGSEVFRNIDTIPATR